MRSFDGNRVVRDTGATYPIFNAPIGYFARASLAGAVSAAGGMGLLETSRPTNYYDPGKFWSGDDLELLRGARLGDEIQVVTDP